jgi:tetratricopeptide (TPR) repeat protein
MAFVPLEHRRGSSGSNLAAVCYESAKGIDISGIQPVRRSLHLFNIARITFALKRTLPATWANLPFADDLPDHWMSAQTTLMETDISALITETYIEVGTIALFSSQDSIGDRFLAAALQERERAAMSSFHIAATARRLARIYAQFERFDQSLNLLRRAYQIYRIDPSGSFLCAEVLEELAEVTSLLSKPKGAMLYRQRARIQALRATMALSKAHKPFTQER